MNPRNPSRSFALALVVAIGLTACSKATPSAATVGATRITDLQLTTEAKLFTFLAGLNQVQCGTKDGSETQESACNRFALADLIESVFVVRYASQHSVTVSDADLQKTLGGIDTTLGAGKVDKALSDNGLTRQDLRALVNEVLLFQAVGTNITKAQVGDAQLRQVYQQQILEFTTVDVDHILVKTKAEAAQAYLTVTAPGATEKTFLDLAKQISIDPSAKQNSGALGSKVASTYVPQFAKAAAALNPGQISKPVHSQFGWHVIRLNSKQVAPYEQASTQLIQSRSQQIFQNWLKSQSQSETISVNPKYGVFNATNLTVDRISSTGGSPSTSASLPGSSSPTP